jgi:hypothetical protein
MEPSKDPSKGKRKRSTLQDADDTRPSESGKKWFIEQQIRRAEEAMRADPSRKYTTATKYPPCEPKELGGILFNILGKRPFITLSCTDRDRNEWNAQYRRNLATQAGSTTTKPYVLTHRFEFTQWVPSGDNDEQTVFENKEHLVVTTSAISLSPSSSDDGGQK